MNDGLGLRRLLVSGAGGQLGAGFLDACAAHGVEVRPLLRRSGRSTLLARSGHPALGGPVHGDVRLPDWALDDEAVDSLRDVDAVVNLAGLVDWSASEVDLGQTNAQAARHGLRLAERLNRAGGRCRSFLHVSSTAVAGTAAGWIPETWLPPGTRRTAYERSKWLAEHLLRPGSKDVGVGIARVCGLLGDSRTGASAGRGSAYLLADFLGRFGHPVLPAAPGARLDLLPRDVAGALVLRVADHVSSAGSTLVHVCSGERAPLLTEVLAAVNDRRGELGGARVARLPLARTLLRCSELAGVPGVVPPRYRNAVIGLRYLALEQRFERHRLAAAVRGSLPGLGAAEIAGHLVGTLDHAPPPDTLTGPFAGFTPWPS